MSTKILVSGDVAGHFTALFARVSKIQSSKAGPFHALLLVGSVFGRKGAAELDDYVHGKLAVPLPIYFIAGDEFDTKLIDSMPAGGLVCPNMHYLGRAGVAALQLGSATLRVAYLSGVYDQSSYFNTMSATGGARMTKYQTHYIEEDVLALLSAGVKEDVDILLTSEWGKGWQAGLPAEKVPAALRDAPHGSPVVAKLASQLAARYHFAGTQDTYFELPPYRNRTFVTRFFGLGAAVSERKEKNLYACNVAPYAAIDRAAIPAETTACPYTLGKAGPSAAAAASHDFPTDSGAKRQKIEPGTTGGAGFIDPRMAATAAAEMSLGPSTMRWNFAKPERGPPPHSYVCRICQEPGHWIDDCPQKADRRGGADSDVPPPGYLCKKCNQGGHFLRLCPLIVAENAQRAVTASQLGVPADLIPSPSYVCAKCGKAGAHFIQRCPLVLAERAAGPQGAPPASYVCKVCKQSGHWIQQCEVVLKEQAERDAQRGSKRPPPGYVCHRCQAKEDHLVTNCPTARAYGSSEGANGPRAMDANGLPLGTKEDCWFCLATEHVSTHLILSVGVENYVALAKGALNSEHVLILPIVHVANSLELTPEQSVEMERYKLALRRYYRSKGLECVMYERFIPTRAAAHLHIQVVPVTRDQARAAKQLLHQQAKLLHESLTFQDIARGHTLLQANPGRQPFIAFEFPSFDDAAAAAAASSSASASSLTATDFPLDRLIHYVQHRVKVFGLFDFPRALCATILGRPDRSDWKKCTESEADETDKVETMKASFAPFDFTLDAAEGVKEEGAAAMVTDAK